MAELPGTLRRLAAVCAETANILEDRLAACPASSDIGSADMSGHQQTDEDIAPEAEPLLTVGDVAQLLQVNPRTVRRWRQDAQLPPAIELGGIIRWRRSDFDEWLDARRGRAS